MEKEKDHSQEREVKLKTVILAIFLMLVAYLLVVGALIYVFNVDNKVIQVTTRYVPYPVAIINQKIVTLEESKKRMEAVRHFYENQDFSELGLRVDFTTDDGKKRLKIKEKNILNKLLEDKIIEREANVRGIELSKEMISQEVNRKLSEYGHREELMNNLQKLYGWELSDFEKNIVKPDLYKEKLADNIRENDSERINAKNKINKALEELENGKDFELVVSQYSEGDSAKNRGDLGWFSKTEMLPEIAQIAFEMKKKEYSEIIESSLGYHIIKVEDEKSGEHEEIKLRLRQIFVRADSFNDWLSGRMKEYHIFIPLNDYYWNKENNRVEFSDEELRKFEENIMNNSPDDISVIF